MYGTFIKKSIDRDKILENKTRKYLYPPLISLGRDFINHFTKQNKMAFGINDVITHFCNIFYENSLFILLKPESVNFQFFLEWLQSKDYYVNDYSYDSLLFGKYHIIVIKYPVKTAYQNFLEGKYSQMFTENEIKKYFKKEDTIGILKKEKSQKEKFKKMIQKEFEYQGLITDFFIEEYDIIFSKNQEIFNYNLIEDVKE